MVAVIAVALAGLIGSGLHYVQGGKK